MLSAFIWVVGLLVVLWWLFSTLTRHKDEPPGPQKIPFLGNLVQVLLTKELTVPVRAFHKLAEKYGGIMSLRLGFVNSIVVSNYEDYKEVMIRDELADRSAYGALLDRNLGDKDIGIAFSNGERWRSMRRWTIRTLRDYGFGKKHTQDSLMDMEGQDLLMYIDDIAKSNNGVVHIHNFHALTTLNVLWSMVAGFRYNLTDKRLRELLYLSSEQLKATNFSVSICAAFPFMWELFPKLSGKDTLMLASRNLSDFLKEGLNEHRNRGEYATNPSCVIDVFLGKIDEDQGKPDALFTDNNFVMTMTDLFQAGSETASNVLDFAVLFMMHNPHIQTKVQNEIDDVISKGRSIEMDDKNKLPYTYATVLELHRCANVVPIQINRSVTDDFYCRGYRFRKGYTVLASTYTFFNDKFWGDPEAFRPDRFLDKDKNFIPEKVERILPFGIGKRVCPGQGLGDAMVFMFFATVMQHYTISAVPGKPLPTLLPREGMTTSPRPFDAVFTRRI